MTRPIGRGWATVDLDRAEAGLRGLIGDGADFEDAPRSTSLGAKARRARGIDGDWIVLLEPDTEGRLAGFLARHGEGWAATWRAVDSIPGRAVTGPIGAELLAADQPIRGPFRLLVAAATIEP
jgi:hypothetical protein